MYINTQIYKVQWHHTREVKKKNKISEKWKWEQNHKPQCIAFLGFPSFCLALFISTCCCSYIWLYKHKEGGYGLSLISISNMKSNLRLISTYRSHLYAQDEGRISNYISYTYSYSCCNVYAVSDKHFNINANQTIIFNGK